MLSLNIICAAHVLLELDKVRNNPKKADRGLFPHEFGIDDELRRPVLRRVLQTLLQSGYVTVATNKKYAAVIDAGQITMLDIVRLFHGGVCMGEAFDHYMSIGREYLQTPEYRNLLKFEMRLAQELSHRLQVIRLRDFRGEVPMRLIVETPNVVSGVVINE